MTLRKTKTYDADGLAMWITGNRATVLESKTTDITSVRQDRGMPGYVAGVGMVREHGAVYSQTATAKRMWVRYEDSVEEELDFSLLDMSVRAGHEILVVTTGWEGYEGKVVAIQNLSTSKSSVAAATKELSAALALTQDGRYWRGMKKVGLTVAGLVGLGNLLSLMTGSIGLGLTLFFAVLQWGVLTFFACCFYLFYAFATKWRKPAETVHVEANAALAELRVKQASKA